MLIMMVTSAMVMLMVIDYFVRAIKSLSLQSYFDVGASIAVAISPSSLVM